MKVVRFIVFLALALFIAYARYAGVSPAHNSRAPTLANQASAQSTVAASVPQKALQVLQIVRSTGQPPEGYVGGRVFQNREGRLPAEGDYREFDVDPHHGGRNAERIIVEWNTKKAWYTDDHYQTFTPLP